MTYKCVRCGGPIVPGVNGFIHGLSRSPDGDPSGAIKDTLQGVHYPKDCGNKAAKVPSVQLARDTAKG